MAQLIHHPLLLSQAHQLLLGRRVDVNLATVSELDLVPGISPRKALEIIKFREEAQGIRNINDLIQIKGIGKKTLAKMSPYLKTGIQ